MIFSVCFVLRNYLPFIPKFHLLITIYVCILIISKNTHKYKNKGEIRMHIHNIYVCVWEKQFEGLVKCWGKFVCQKVVNINNFNIFAMIKNLWIINFFQKYLPFHFIFQIIFFLNYLIKKFFISIILNFYFNSKA